MRLLACVLQPVLALLFPRRATAAAATPSGFCAWSCIILQGSIVPSLQQPKVRYSINELLNALSNHIRRDGGVACVEMLAQHSSREAKRLSMNRPMSRYPCHLMSDATRTTSRRHLLISDTNSDSPKVCFRLA
ncbi:hypothetical protein BC939DRAFT_494056 [Gamsiella multidivaricata]|uniref:uncharacterized protein n=1 Tax=Gamsiella multidivaricata TaxID=101098 RepID=UPI00221FC2AE|nr:uncharacterized protein BC939DRAFT_494056 [Gamsiella multidivaricata]KAI7821589.1 hypothetical protein BC939DRAFT_494056 [Gamsiella multidivaricata]